VEITCLSVDLTISIVRLRFFIMRHLFDVQLTNPMSLPSTDIPKRVIAQPPRQRNFAKNFKPCQSNHSNKEEIVAGRWRVPKTPPV
jgi:hypothetical protein